MIKPQAIQTFEDGTVHTAHITFTNPKNQAITYKAKVYFADPANYLVPVTESNEVTFTVPASGTSSPQDFSIVAPLLAVSTFTFLACCQIKIGTTLLTTFVGADSIIVNFTPSVGWGDITWD